MINTAPIGVVMVDAKRGRVETINAEARRILSAICPPGESIEQQLDVLTVQRADGRVVSMGDQSITKALSTGETVSAEELQVRGADGSSVSILIYATPLRSDDGEPESYIVSMQDMAPLRELERLRAEFLAMVSHELRMR